MQLLIDGVSVMRGERLVVSDVSATVSAGEALAVTGPNGAGKSTLLRAIAGLLPISAGAIRFEGAPSEADTLHYIAHLNAVKLAQSVRDNAAFWHRWFAGPGAAETAVEHALDSVGLLHLADLPAGTLSQGQRRRLALSRLVLAPRPLWLLDEPTAGLDTAAQDTFASLLATHLSGGGLVVAATHDPLRAAPLRTLPLGPANRRPRPPQNERN